MSCFILHTWIERYIFTVFTISTYFNLNLTCLGPAWLPIVGNLPELKKLSMKLGGQHLALSELSQKHNTNVLGLKLGNDYVIVVFAYPVVKAILTREEYEGRPDSFFIRLRSMGTRKGKYCFNRFAIQKEIDNYFLKYAGITCTDGNLWCTQRNFVVKHLRSLGFGKTTMEVMINEELQEVLQILKNEHTDVQIGNILAPSVLNVLWALTAGTRISRTDPRLSRLLALLDIRAKAFDMSGGTLSQHPWLRFIAPEKTGYNLLQKLNGELHSFFLDTINEHEKNWCEGKDDDIIYNFISEMKQSESGTTFTRK